MLADDPEAPTTTDEAVRLRPADRRRRCAARSSSTPARSRASTRGSRPRRRPPPPRPQAGLELAARRAQRSATGNTLAVMGPQLGYYYPEIVQQIDLHGPGINAQGVAVPGLAMYILIGRTQDYAWSLTSAGHDVRDVFAERLCEPDGSEPTRASDALRVPGQCRAFEDFNAGLLNGEPLRYKVSVHGPVFATATVGRRAVRAVAQALDLRPRRAQPRRAQGHDRGRGDARRSASGRAPTSSASRSTGRYVSRKFTAYFSSGRLPERAARARPPAADARRRALTSGRASSARASTRTTRAAPAGCC